MRSEQEMYELILETARSDARIRAVILNGSRANPEARRDPLQDFDVVYLVTEVVPFRHNLEWIRRFGELMILQLPDEMADPPQEYNPGYAYLMQFADGSRIDLNIFPLEKIEELRQDSHSVLLLDKDGVIEPFPPPDDRSYLPQPPAAKAFADCCNEFWWVCPYVAKGLWRGEIAYAKHCADHYVREQLNKMLAWYIGVQTGFRRSPGKFGKYFERYLEPELWELFLKTYAGSDEAANWEALFAVGELFRLAATQVAAHFGYEYPHGDDERVSAHLRHVRTLPKDAQEIY